VAVVVCLAPLENIRWKKQIAGTARAGVTIISIFIIVITFLFLFRSGSSGGSNMPGATGNLLLGEADRWVCARR